MRDATSRREDPQAAAPQGPAARAASQHRLHREHGIRAQVVIHGLDGRIKEERTYPDTTPNRKG